MEKKLFQYSDAESIERPLLVREKNIQLGKNGRPFLSLVLGDASGAMDARLWDNVESLAKTFEVGDVLQIKGTVQLYQGRLQIILHRLESLDKTLFNMEEFIPQSNLKSEDLYAELTLLVRSVSNPSLKQLMLNTIEDPEIKERLLLAPAAKSIHHAWLGGLLEHIVSMAKILDQLSRHYSYLNRDLLIFGALFHDLGKIWELSWDKGFNYTDRGRLIGHMEMACELVDIKSQRILGFDSELRDLCKHIILSHHGKLEYGSPKRPKFLEALLVSMVDDLDSKMSTVKSLLEAERQIGNNKWTRYNELFDRYFLVDDLKEKFECSDS